MGTFNHNVVVATCLYGESKKDKVISWIESLPEELRNLFVTNSHVLANDATTIVLTPDGSKEFWPASDRGDTLRADFIAKLNEQAYSDNSNSWSWIEVSYGELGSCIEGTNVNDEYCEPEEDAE